jgi:hypothetical protein
VALEPSPTRRALGELLLQQQIGLGDDPGYAPVLVQDRQGADLTFGYRRRDLL